MKYNIEIFCGGTYCGNGIFETLDDCRTFFENDEFCDRAKIIDLETGTTYKVKKGEQR